jgi:hypothetical protein
MVFPFVLIAAVFLVAPLVAQSSASTGSIAGKITLAATGNPLHHASVLLLPLGRVVESDDDGLYR